MGLYVLKYPARKLLDPLAGALGWVHPDVLSYLATALTVGTGACYLFAADRPALLLWAVGGTLLRMALNTLDGVIAVRRGKLRGKGEIVNALPDRYSDILLVAGIALSPLCRPLWGLAGLASMLLVSYTGMLGKALGVDWQHQGPLGKVERLIAVMVFSLIQFFRLRAAAAGWTIMGLSLTPLEACMILFVVLGQVTVLNRTRGMLRQIRRMEWRKDLAGRGLHRRALVAYDSLTGNTAKVAAAVAEALHADLKRVENAANGETYDLVVIGSPTISSKPTDKVMRFLRAQPALRNYAAFTTYGAPVVGPKTARRCLGCITSAVGRPPLATFMCIGFHPLIKVINRSRPNDNDLLDAFLFGMRLAMAAGGPEGNRQDAAREASR